MGNIESAQGHFNFHSRRHVLAEHFNNPANRTDPATGTLSNFHHHHIALSGTVRVFWWNNNLKVDTAVIRNHHSHALLGKIPANNGFFAGLYHLINIGFATTTAVCTALTGFHPVVVHKHLHLPGTDKQIAGIVIGTQETVTVTVTYNSPADKLFLL